MLPLIALANLSCSAQHKARIHRTPKPITTDTAVAVIDTFKAEKNKKGDAFPEMAIRTWDNKIITNKDLIPGEPILFILFNPGCGHCKDIITAITTNLGMLKNANIIFLAGKPLQGELPRFVGEMKLDKTEEIVMAGDDSGVIDQVFEYNGIPQIMLYNQNHKLEHIYYSEASMRDIQQKMYVK